MKNYSPRRKILFDGDQEDLIGHCWSVHCPNCKSNVSFNASDAISLIEASRDIVDMVVEKIPKISVVDLCDVKFYKFESLPVYCLYKGCSDCFEQIILVAGIGEYQPGRFIIVSAGVFLAPKESS